MKTVCVCVYVYIYIYTYIYHILTHTYIYIYKSTYVCISATVPAARCGVLECLMLSCGKVLCFIRADPPTSQHAPFENRPPNFSSWPPFQRLNSSLTQRPRDPPPCLRHDVEC